MLAVRGLDGSLRAIVFGYACHNTTLNDYQSQRGLGWLCPGGAGKGTSRGHGDVHPRLRAKLLSGLASLQRTTFSDMAVLRAEAVGSLWASSANREVESASYPSS